MGERKVRPKNTWWAVRWVQPLGRLLGVGVHVRGVAEQTDPLFLLPLLSHLKERREQLQASQLVTGTKLAKL